MEDGNTQNIISGDLPRIPFKSSTERISMDVKKVLEARRSKGEENNPKRLEGRVPAANLGYNSSCSHQLYWKNIINHMASGRVH